MRSVRVPLFIGALALFATDWATPAIGQAAMGTVDAIGGVVPPQTPLRVSSADFTDLNQRLERVVVRALRKQGYTVSNDATLVLSYAAGATATGGRRGEQSLDLGTVPPSPGTTSDPAAEVKRRNPFLRAEPAITEPGTGRRSLGRTYSLSFVVARAGEAPMWQGSVSARMLERDAFDAAQRLVPVLVAHLGETTRGQPVDIP